LEWGYAVFQVPQVSGKVGVTLFFEGRIGVFTQTRKRRVLHAERACAEAWSCETETA
jgi:hypothetical protein